MSIEDRLEKMIEERTGKKGEKEGVLKKLKSPKPKGKVVRGFRLPEVVVKRLEVLRAHESRELGEIVSDAVNEYFSRKLPEFDEVARRYFEKKYGEDVFRVE